MSSACKRSWEVEALEDGRLRDKDRESLERHSETCADCKRLLSRLRELGTLFDALPAAAATDLEHRRSRSALLARANDAIVGDGASPRRRPTFGLVAFASAAILAVLVVVFGWREVTRAPASTATAPTAPAAVAPLFEVADVDHADFASERTGGVSRVTLRSGSAAFHVEHVTPGARFLVAVPDGEVEVRGTRFVVDVADGRTRSVVVTEGVVAVRVKGFDGILTAGERWPAAAATADVPSRVPSAPGAPPATASVTAPTLAPTTGTSGQALPRGVAGERFARAMTSFSAGDYGEADRAFVAFVRDFPADSRAEDAMFLVADARARRGDTTGARDAARAYLRRFPNGLRAPAAERLAGDGPR